MGDADMAEQRLERSLGLFDVLMFGVGGIVGAGIYAIIGEAAGLAGAMVWASFGIAAVVAFLTGLTYAEFVSRFPDAGGSFEYVKRGFGRRAALWLAIVMLFTNTVAPAAIAISFSDYLSHFVDLPSWLGTVGVILLMGGVNVVGVQQSSWFNTLATVVTLLGLGTVVAFSIPRWGSTDLLTVPSAGTSGLVAGAALIFFSYVGFEDLVKMAEETKDPEKTMPRGILISAAVVLAIYVAVAVSAVSVMDPGELAESPGPLAAVLGGVAGPAWVTGLIVVALFATSKTVLSNILGSSRLLYDVARDSGLGWLERLTEVNEATGTPIFATLATMAIVVAVGLIGNLKLVASLSNVFVLLLFLVVNAALIRFRLRHQRGDAAVFRVPLNVGRVPVPAVVAMLGLATLLVFNVMSVVRGF